MTTDTPLRLRDAAELFGLPLAAVRSEAALGRLTLWKIGGRYYTNRESVAEMDRCRYARRNTDHKGSGIYVVGFDNYIKIGWSDDLSERLRTIKTSIPVPLTIYASYSCQKINERILHRRFRKHRTRGEWYRNEGDVADWIKRKCPL